MEIEKKYKWLTILGKAIIEDNKIMYNPTTSNTTLDATNKGSWSVGTYLKSNVFFDSGEISFKVTFEKQGTGGCFIQLNSDTDAQPIKLGIHNDGGLFSASKLNNNQYDFLQFVGEANQLTVNKPYDFKLIIAGSKIELFVNDIQVLNLNEFIKRSQIQLRFQGYAKIEVTDFEVRSQKKRAFVIMQFSDEYNALYKDVIKLVAEENNDLICERADDYFTATPILQDIENSIKEASVVIADITPNNPNVFYEVGYSHAIGKPTILLCDRKREKLPFDLSGFRTLFYDNSIAGKSQIEDKLRKFLATAL